MIEINRDPTPGQLRGFAGIWLPLLCGVVGAMLWWRLGYRTAAIAVWASAGGVMLVGLAVPAAIKPLFVGMMFAAAPIGWVVGHVLLLTVYYFVLTPIGLIMRLFGRDPLARRVDKSAESYWVDHAPPEAPERYFQQH